MCFHNNLRKLCLSFNQLTTGKVTELKSKMQDSVKYLWAAFNRKRDRELVYKYAPGDGLIQSKGVFICYTHSC